MKQKKLHVWLPLLLSVVMVAGMTIGYKLRKDTVGANTFWKNKPSATISQAVDIIDKMYVDNVNADSLQMNAINDLLSQLDPFSVYITKQQIRHIDDETRGFFRGIGIGFELIRDSVTITNINAGSPAAKVDIHVGDRFLAFNDSIQLSGPNRSNRGVVNLLNDLGPKINIRLIRNGKIINTSVTKTILAIPSLDAAYMLDATTAYVRLNRFSETTYRELMLAMEKLKSKGMKQLVLDLRGNAGGLLGAAVEIANEFLKDNQLITYTEGAKVGRKEYRCKRDGFYMQLPTVLLVDETTASASEVLAGALQDWDRATIIGRRTFGKGLVQDQFNLSNGGALRLTVARYYTPLGRNIQKPYSEITGDKYKQQLTTRFHNGEVVLGDTSAPAGRTFKTPGGRTVYGGGGITPDVSIPYNATLLPPQAAQLFLKGTLVKFAFLYYMQHQSEINRMANAATLLQVVKPDEALWQSLSDFARADSIDLDGIDAQVKTNVMDKFKALLAKNRFGSEGFFEINNVRDEMVKKAMEVIGKK